MIIYIFGNGNLSFQRFLEHYLQPLKHYLDEQEVAYVLGDFRGADTLTMELLKTTSGRVSVYHLFEAPRFVPDKYKTKVSAWTFHGGFQSDEERDDAMIRQCTHFLGVDFNTTPKRESGTHRNIRKCLAAGKIRLE